VVAPSEDGEAVMKQIVAFYDLLEIAEELNNQLEIAAGKRVSYALIVFDGDSVQPITNAESMTQAVEALHRGIAWCKLGASPCSGAPQ
jgi:hypothetical protein